MTNVFNIIREINNVTGFNRAEAIEALREAEIADDFTLGRFRFIHSSSIDSIMADEMESCEHTLGCYSAGAIADATQWPEFLIKAAQKAEEFEKIGSAIVDEGHTPDLQNIVAGYDGYGPHFAHYDGEEHEITAGRNIWHVFKVD